ncbi:MAG: uracil-DNA glycosylase [Bacteroidota bacterium]|nr:uracil-DNA glycosylase [Bacteroidota bacterium]
MTVNIHPSWHEVLKDEFEKPYFEQLVSFVKEEYKSKTIYPPGKLIFEAFSQTPFDKVKVVIIGQDPYHGPGQAHGLCFSVNDNIKIPPSLVNIYKEVATDLGRKTSNTSGNLTNWAKNGVLLLNATLTVRASEAGSHQGKGWEQFTDAVISQLNMKRKNIVYLLWGSYAQKKGAIVDKNNNYVLQTVHPSPLSAYNGFFGCKHFSKCNEYLQKNNLEIINW